MPFRCSLNLNVTFSLSYVRFATPVLSAVPVNLSLDFCWVRHFTPPHISGLRRAKIRKDSVGVRGLRLLAIATATLSNALDNSPLLCFGNGLSQPRDKIRSPRLYRATSNSAKCAALMFSFFASAFSVIRSFVALNYRFDCTGFIRRFLALWYCLKN